MKKLRIYTDGACRGNPGPGGWGVVFLYGKHEKHFKGYDPKTTNNRMELQAAIFALSHLKERCDVTLVTDSQYVRLGITQWLANWKAKGWKTAAKKPVKNQDLWIALDALSNTQQVHWQWVKGHNGDVHNEQADLLANQAIDEGA